MIKQYSYNEINIVDIFSRVEEKKNKITDVVAEIIATVRQKGDIALRDYSLRFDGAVLEEMEVLSEEIEKAYQDVDEEFISILEEAAEHIRGYHEKQKRSDMMYMPREGVVLGQKITPLDRVGLYVPGGTANYPSTVLMNGIPAKIAGVKEVIMVTPAKGGKISNEVLAAAKIAGVDRIFKIGGAQAIAALAYGTETIPRVDKIVGPGNAFVAEAKKQVFGKVAIDMIAGPSEILVIADGQADGAVVAADMLSQAEHDEMASAVLITDSKELAEAVSVCLEQQIPLLPRKDIARKSIDDSGKIILAKSIEESIEIANQIAPEHLELCVDNPFDYLGQIRHAGSIFLGKNAPEALGDYFSGTNHTLPTGGSARFASPLSVDDFIKKSSFTYYTKDALAKEAEKINTFAKREGLTAHGKSVMIRFEKEAEE
ncbi:histidinol dehydrogenase [Anaerotignum sp.]|uniref:histidinol dehydrogenase n=1 Tax=Anaerotignum sp. TaxID=2039241 RepID=UPI002898C1F1|nr:histidinol dehydrogenase [Anaerotignum sp.]